MNFGYVTVNGVNSNDVLVTVYTLRDITSEQLHHISWKMSFNPMYIENDVKIFYSKVMEIQ